MEVLINEGMCHEYLLCLVICPPVWGGSMRQGANDGNWMKDIHCHEHLAKIAEGFDSLLKKGMKKKSEAEALERALCFGLRGGRFELRSILLVSIALGFECATQRFVEVAKAKGSGQLLGILSNDTDLARAAAECPNPSILEFLATEVFAMIGV